ncbi:MAG: hypothetical protein M1829_003381 [Trizodia sp. TS-e1964]|nr:MAG: hypothetical protein M1829_003381 [Trizodia sp. TS-e1964]
MIKAGVPCIPGYHGKNQDPDFLQAEAAHIGYPVLLKAVKGGGGKGMRIVNSPAEFKQQLESAKSEARNSFGDDVMLVEKYITTPRHIEVQVFADKHGNCVALGERDCSIQRRHQKILEESPAPNLAENIREDIWGKARAAALAVGYEGAGTVEFIFDNESGDFFFMEMNTRLQVEHPVTEMVTGEDLVSWQFLVAQGERLPLTQEEVKARIAERGWGIEARIYAENPETNFMPDSGRLIHLKTPKTSETVRIDAGFIQGDMISPHYDPMIAKLIVGAPTREEAIQKLGFALQNYQVVGPSTNIDFLKRLCESPQFIQGDVETGFIEKHRTKLFTRKELANEVFAQAALGMLMESIAHSSLGSSGAILGFGQGYQNRSFWFVESSAQNPTKTNVQIRQTGPSIFDITVNDSVFIGVTTNLDRSSNVLRSFYPHTRLESTIIQDGDSLTIFQRGSSHKLEYVSPGWVSEALGIKDTANSVVAPMPCKVLRIEVEEGQAVRKDQALVVIESMKMETVIRSPHDGVISRVIHRSGDLCKAGTALVEFEDAAGECSE